MWSKWAEIVGWATDKVHEKTWSRRQLQEEELGPFQLNYMQFYDESGTLAIVVLMIWVAFMINLLGNTAGNYLSPTLANVCEKLKLPYNVAGATFLAFGNGAPDVFALVASFTHAETVNKDQMQVGIGALLGAGMFVTTVVVGSITIIAPCELKPRVFLRDIVFYMSALAMLSVFVYEKEITISLAIIPLIMYIAYVIMVVFACDDDSELPNSRIDTYSVLTAYSRTHSDVKPPHRMRVKSVELPSSDVHDGAGHPADDGSGRVDVEANNEPLPDQSSTEKGSAVGQADSDDEDESEETGEEEVARKRTDTGGGLGISLMGFMLNDYFEVDPERRASDGSSLMESLLRDPSFVPPPITNGTFSEHFQWHQWAIRRRLQRHMMRSDFWKYSLFEKIVACIESPFTFARDITIPSTDEAVWVKPYAVLQPVCAVQLVFGILESTDSSVDYTGGYVTLTVLSIIASILVHLYAKTSGPPDSIWWSIVGFCMCVFWIYMLASELVTCLTAMGTMFGAPPAMLGLTVLAWGNSLGDWMANTAVARQGRGEMAIAGCYAGPAFNLFVGLGISLLVCTLKTMPGDVELEIDSHSFISIVFLFVSLGTALIVIPQKGFRLDSQVGYLLIGIYLAYTLVQLTVLALEKTDQPTGLN